MRLPVLTTMLIVTAAPSLAGAHEWYTGLRSPTGVDCCGESDCHPVSYRRNPKRGGRRSTPMTSGTRSSMTKSCPFNFHCIILPGMTDAEGMTVLLFQA